MRSDAQTVFGLLKLLYHHDDLTTEGVRSCLEPGLNRHYSTKMRHQQMLAVLDQINSKWSRGALRLAGVPIAPEWAMRRDIYEPQLHNQTH